MATARFRASSFVAPAFASVASAVDAGDGSYATWTSSQRRGSTTGTFSGFDFSSLGQAELLSVAAEIRHYEDAGGDMNYVAVEGTNVPTLSLAPVVHSIALPTVLPSSITVNWVRGNNTRSTECAVDWLDVVVEYNPFLGSELQAYVGGSWTPGRLKKWNGSAWEPALLRRWDGSQWVEVL